MTPPFLKAKSDSKSGGDHDDLNLAAILIGICTIFVGCQSVKMVPGECIGTCAKDTFPLALTSADSMNQ